MEMHLLGKSFTGRSYIKSCQILLNCPIWEILIDYGVTKAETNLRFVSAFVRPQTQVNMEQKSKPFQSVNLGILEMIASLVYFRYTLYTLKGVKGVSEVTP